MPKKPMSCLRLLNGEGRRLADTWHLHGMGEKKICFTLNIALKNKMVVKLLLSNFHEFKLLYLIITFIEVIPYIKKVAFFDRSSLFYFFLSFCVCAFHLNDGRTITKVKDCKLSRSKGQCQPFNVKNLNTFFAPSQTDLERQTH